MTGETIERAAIWHDGQIFSVPRPGRHHDVIALMAKRRTHKASDCIWQGFVTSTGRYVPRKEAMKIAKAAGQIITQFEAADGVVFSRSPRDKLYSEDLW